MSYMHADLAAGWTRGWDEAENSRVRGFRARTHTLPTCAYAPLPQPLPNVRAVRYAQLHRYPWPRASGARGHHLVTALRGVWCSTA